MTQDPGIMTPVIFTCTPKIGEDLLLDSLLIGFVVFNSVLQPSVDVVVPCFVLVDITWHILGDRLIPEQLL